MHCPTDTLDERFVRVGKGWTAQMREMADHIGAYKTLLICAVHGGRQIYIASDPNKNFLRSLVGAAAAQTLSHVYKRERLTIPTAKAAIAIARRGPVLSAVRRGVLTKSEAATMLKSSRSYVSYLIHHTDEAKLVTGHLACSNLASDTSR